MSFIEMVTIQKGGVLQWQRTKMKKRKTKTNNKINLRLAIQS